MPCGVGGVPTGAGLVDGGVDLDFRGRGQGRVFCRFWSGGKWRFLKDALWGGGAGLVDGEVDQGPWLQERVGGGVGAFLGSVPLPLTLPEPKPLHPRALAPPP